MKWAIVFFILISSFPVFGLDSLNLRLFGFAQEIEYKGNIQVLASELEMKCRSKFETVEIISYWLAQNIDYDTGKYLFGNIDGNRSSVRKILQTKKGVCRDYANLFQELCRLTGIKSYKIVGYAKGNDYVEGAGFLNANHTWNVVMLMNDYYFVDLTWASGGIHSWTKKFVRSINVDQILCQSNSFRETHLPVDPRWQLTQNVISYESFVSNNKFENMQVNSAIEYNYRDSISRYDSMTIAERKLISAESAFNFNKTNRNKRFLARIYEYQAYKLAHSKYSEDLILKSIKYYQRAIELFIELDKESDRSEDVISAKSGERYADYRFRTKK